MTKIVLTQVFSHAYYTIATFLIGFIVMSIVLLLPNLGVIKQVLSSSLEFGTKLSMVVSLYGTLFTSNTVFSGVVLVLTVLLFAVNVSLLVYYIKRRQTKIMNKKIRITSLGGTISAILGIGCVTCGSVVITTISALLGVGSVTLWLPLDGAEFGVIGIILLLLSIRYLIKNISNPLVCRADL